jgi:hypothetical protein
MIELFFGGDFGGLARVRARNARENQANEGIDSLVRGGRGRGMNPGTHERGKQELRRQESGNLADRDRFEKVCFQGILSDESNGSDGSEEWTG